MGRHYKGGGESVYTYMRTNVHTHIPADLEKDVKALEGEKRELEASLQETATDALASAIENKELCKQTQVCMHTCMYARLYVCLSVCMFDCLFVYRCMYMHVFIN